MFTGLVNGQGSVISAARFQGEVRLTIHPDFTWDKPSIGESVACNGVCLTMESWDALRRTFNAYASAETCSCSTIGSLTAGAVINLERALALGDRLGGHIVSGHVDAVVSVISTEESGESKKNRFSFGTEWNTLIVPKGSVTLDGVSLTVNACGEGWFEVNVIPETQRMTTARLWKPGSRVNFEADAIAKYVRNLLQPYAPAAPAAESRVTMEFLRRNGF
ncbi:MAG: riboflavin synthase [Mailhella sp.]|nr:riboflavin synthase [Mailhella sp.]